jgi:peptidoglycan/LPS O-acetylase OafA/YrhL
MPRDARKPILLIVLVFAVAFGGLTLDVLIRTGPDVLTLGSLLILAMFVFGIIGALREPTDRR